MTPRTALAEAGVGPAAWDRHFFTPLRMRECEPKAVVVISAVGRKGESPARTWTHGPFHSMAAGMGHWGPAPLFHLHVIPAINPSDKLELSSIDMFTREVHI